MKIESRYLVRFRSRAVACGAMALALFANYPAMGADIPADSLKIAPGVAMASGYETPATSYVVANETNIFSDLTIYGAKVTGELKRRESAPSA
jgi:hypothetical protein